MPENLGQKERGVPVLQERYHRGRRSGVLKMRACEVLQISFFK
tara:strand:- start:291 stop:419 length:129 start_codon:yes stop_codon:yes gene_type:complete